MKAIYAAIVLVIAFSVPVNAHYHHAVVASVAKSSSVSGSGGVLCAGGCVWVGGFIAAIAGAIIIHEIMGPACARKGLKNGYDEPRFWRPLCRKGDPKPIAVRG